jgi:hypothetical protein
VAGGVDGAVEDVDDAVAYFLAAEVGCEDCCDVWVVGEAGFVRLVYMLELNTIICRSGLTVARSVRRCA